MGIIYTKAQLKANELLKKDITNILFYGGSRSGKTFLLTLYCVLVAGAYPGIRIAILRRYLKDVRESVLADTFPKVLIKGFGWSSYKFESCINRAEMIFKYKNSEIWFAGLDDKDRVEKILGKEFGMIYFNEVSQIPWQSIQVARTRLAQKVDIPPFYGATQWQPRFLYDCNPPAKSHWVYRTFIEKLGPDRTPINNPESYAAFRMNPQDNKENISESYLEILNELKGNNRKRFLEGEFSDENENALWKQSTMIDPFRVINIPNDLERIVIGVDPAVTSNENSDTTGIVVAGKKRGIDGRDHFYILDDKSLSGSPRQWAQAVCFAFDQYKADRVVAEVNQGGDLVTSVLRQIDSDLPIKTVHATRGKIVRAEPIAALYEQGLVHHVGGFSDLEDELTSYTGDATESSPDRMDALVWAITELIDDTDVMVGNFSFL